MNFLARLDAAWRKNDSLLCVGLDPDPTRLPPQFAGRRDALYLFCREIVAATADLVCAYKPQIAYFAAHRAEDQLEALIDYIHTHHPEIPVILDAKRGDIGATATLYAQEAFVRYRADAVTVNPYLGGDTLEPWLAWETKGLFVLCRTSNAGSADLQTLTCADTGAQLYEIIAEKAVRCWNRTGQLGLVVGATWPVELARVRALVGDMPLLVPGIGAQGGEIAATVRAGQTKEGLGLIINSSRAILYADSGQGFAAAARALAERTRAEINAYRQKG
ncbi:MAG: orotidine-5'-phosphate decarboxylase [Rhodocyclaceae bacterium]|nr:orotidine-5'-phosphate decarboxylase [Rhodocyclaceae bacterium]